MISNSLDTDFIHGDIHGRSCKKDIHIAMDFHNLTTNLTPHQLHGLWKEYKSEHEHCTHC